MSENLAFGLTLNDYVSAAAKKAADSLRRVEEQAKKSQKALDFGKELDRASEKLAKLKADPAGFIAMAKAQKAFTDERKKLLGIEDKIKHGNGFGMIALAHGVGEIMAHAAEHFVETIKEGISEAIHAMGKEEQLRLGYKYTLGEKGAAEFREQSEHFSKKTAFSTSQVQEAMLPLFKAGFKGKAARQAFATATDLATMSGKGADIEAVKENLSILSRIKLKGGVTGKMLAGIGLGESGAAEFAKVLGAKLGVSSKQAMKMAGQPGAVDPQLLQNILGEAIQKRTGKKLGSAGEEAGESFEGRLNKLKELPEEYFRKLVEAPGFKKLEAAMGRILEKLDPDSPLGKKIIGGLMKAFNSVAEFIDDHLTDGAIDTFAEGISGAIDFGKTLFSVFTDLFGIVGSVVKLLDHIGVGAVLKEVISEIKWLVEKLEWLLSLADRYGKGFKAGDVNKYTKNDVLTPEQDAAKYFGVDKAKKARATMRHGEMTLFDEGGGAKKVLSDQGGKLVTVSVPMTVNIDKTGKVDVKYTGQNQNSTVVRHSTAVFERASMEQGAR